MKQSAWEVLTGGQCNNDLVPVKKKAKTAREVKLAVKLQSKRVASKMARITALDAIGTNESRKALKTLSDSWDKRCGTNTKGFWVPGN